MSKRTQRREKQRQRRKKALRDAAIAYAFAAIMIALGVVGFVRNNADLREYQASTDVRGVEATVVSVDVRKDATQEADIPRYLYDAQVEFAVDGTTYTGSALFSEETTAGETVTLEAYRRSDGTYALTNLTDDKDGFWANVPMYLAFVVGGVVAVAATSLTVDALRNKA